MIHTCTGVASENYVYDDSGNVISTIVTIDGVTIMPENINFTPTIETPNLTETVTNTLKNAYYITNERIINEISGSMDDILIKTYLGEYNGHYVADMALSGVEVGATTTIYYIGGVKFVNKGNGHSIYITIEKT